MRYNIGMSCIFCEIVNGNNKGDTQAYKIWDDGDHCAFLSIFPNTEGVTVVIPKKHYPSYAFDLPDDILTNLILAAKKVAKLLDAKLEDVGRTALVFEGFGVDHVHAKLFPMHGTADMAKWKKIEKGRGEYYETYPGFITSHDYDKASDEDLLKTQEKITQ